MDHHQGFLSVCSLYPYKPTNTFIKNIHYCVLYWTFFKVLSSWLISKLFFGIHFFHSALCAWVLATLKHMTLAHLFNFTVLFPCLCVFNHLVMSDSLWPHGLWPARLLCPWDSPGKNAGVGCHSYSRRSSWPRDQNHVSCISCIGRWILYHSASWEAHFIVCINLTSFIHFSVEKSRIVSFFASKPL